MSNKAIKPQVEIKSVEMAGSTFDVGALKTAIANLHNPTTEQFTYDVELYLATDEHGVNKAATSGVGDITIAPGGTAITNFTLTMPSTRAEYYVFIDVKVADTPLILYKAAENIVIQGPMSGGIESAEVQEISWGGGRQLIMRALNTSDRPLYMGYDYQVYFTGEAVSQHIEQWCGMWSSELNRSYAIPVQPGKGFTNQIWQDLIAFPPALHVSDSQTLINAVLIAAEVIPGFEGTPQYPLEVDRRDGIVFGPDLRPLPIIPAPHAVMSRFQYFLYSNHTWQDTPPTEPQNQVGLAVWVSNNGNRDAYIAVDIVKSDTIGGPPPREPGLLRKGRTTVSPFQSKFSTNPGQPVYVDAILRIGLNETDTMEIARASKIYLGTG
ncbi:hypothetical protein ACFLXC_04110 [Chloroflexota bacterium]